MIQKVANAYYFVTAMEQSIAFYRDRLGLKPSYIGEHWTSFNVNGFNFALHYARREEFARSADKYAGAIVTFQVANIDQAVALFESKGVKFKHPISRNPWGSHIDFVDPDGNVLQIRQDPN